MLNFQILTEKDRREAARIETKRRKDEERKKRIFDPKVRLIGIDVEGLKRQIEEKNMRDKDERDTNLAFHEQSRKADEIALLLEQKEKEERLKVELATNEYRRNYQRLEDRREFDLNDPRYILKQTPVRGPDDNENLGISAAQRFEGEDYSREERRKLQSEEIKSWLEQQMRERDMAEKDQKNADHAYHAAMTARDQRAKQLEQLEKECKRKLEQACINFNGALAQEKICQRQRRAKEEADDNMADICNFLNSDLMTENREMAQSNLGPHRKICSLYKGMTPEQQLEFRAEQKAQMEEMRKRKEQERRREKEMDNYMDEIQRTIHLIDQENLIKHKEREKQIVEENKKLAEEQINRKKFLDKVVYASLPSPEFYDQFNRGTR